MPNHVHGIVVIKYKMVETVHEPSLHNYGYGQCPQRGKRSLLSKLIGRFKMQSAKQINVLQNTPKKPFWQSRFYDHIIRNEQSLSRIRQYIIDNPENWDDDRNNPNNL